MDLQCLKWIRQFWVQLVGPLLVHFKRDVKLLPDSVIVEILSRLPADCVLQCRRVCKLWRGLTSTTYFAELHLKRATASLVVNCTMYKHELECFVFNEEAKEGKRFKKIHISSTDILKQHCPVLIGSCNGLLLFKAAFASMFFIYNPITREQISVKTPLQRGFLCGIYFHPLTREYKLLYAHRQLNCFQYSICTLGSKTWRELTSFSFRPALETTVSEIVNGSLHWMVKHEYRNEINIHPCRNAIMVFSMDTENLYAMPHPGIECSSSQMHEKMHLLEMKQQLSLCHLCGKLIDVWVLEDQENWGWVRRYKINLDWDVKRYPFDWSYVNYRVRMLSIQNGELLLAWYSRGLFWYHLELNTVREVESKAMEMLGSKYYYCRKTAYTESLVTLSNIHATGV